MLNWVTQDMPMPTVQTVRHIYETRFLICVIVQLTSLRIFTIRAIHMVLNITAIIFHILVLRPSMVDDGRMILVRRLLQTTVMTGQYIQTTIIPVHLSVDEDDGPPLTRLPVDITDAMRQEPLPLKATHTTRAGMTTMQDATHTNMILKMTTHTAILPTHIPIIKLVLENDPPMIQLHDTRQITKSRLHISKLVLENDPPMIQLHNTHQITKSRLHITKVKARPHPTGIRRDTDPSLYLHKAT